MEQGGPVRKAKARLISVLCHVLARKCTIAFLRSKSHLSHYNWRIIRAMDQKFKVILRATLKQPQNVWDLGMGKGKFYNVFNVAVHSDQAIQVVAKPHKLAGLLRSQ